MMATTKSYEEFVNRGEFVESLVAWLKANDKRLWGDRVKPDAALNEYLAVATGETVDRAVFGRHASKFCGWWRLVTGGKPSTAKAINPAPADPGNFRKDDWDKLKAALRRELADEKSPLNESGVTMNFAIRYLATKGVKVNLMMMRGLSGKEIKELRRRCSAGVEKANL